MLSLEAAHRPLRAPLGASGEQSFMGCRAGLHAPRAAAACSSSGRSARFLVEAATTRAKKSEQLAALKERFNPETATFVAGVNYKGMTVKDFENFRKKLPAGATLLVVKNTLVEKAIEGTKFEPLKQACKGPNAFIFSGEEVAPSIKVFNEMAKTLKKSRQMELEWTGAVFDGSWVPGNKIKDLESMPTKKQLMGKIAGSIKQVTTKVPLAIKQVTAKVGYGVRELADGKSDLIKA